MRGLPNVKETKPGHWFYRTKVKGKTTYVPLPAPSDPKFSAAYARAKARFAKKPAEGVTAGTFSALIRDYRKSTDYQQGLAVTTRSNYDRYLNMIEEKMGAAPVGDLKASRVEKMRDAMAATPGKANNWLNVLNTLLKFGVRRDYVAVSVADGVPQLPTGEHQPWPQEVLDAALAACPSPTTRLAILSGLYSGQRISDIVKITHRMMVGDIMELTQHKQRSKGDRIVTVYIPIHPKWREAVAEVERKTDTIIYDRYGRPFKNPKALQERIRDMMKDLGFVDENGEALYTFHGLRKNSSNYLMEMGLTAEEIGAINGMNADTVRLYTKGVQKRVLVEGAKGKMLAGDVARRGRVVTGSRKGGN